MTSEREIFNLSGPVHLTAVDWTDAYHRRSVLASLVQGVYILERDRQANRHGPEALAPHWWEFFLFQLNEVLIDDVDKSIFGAIYEYKYPAPAEKVPKHVIAFRGTILKPGTRSRDLNLDFLIFMNKLQRSSRFQLAMHSVQKTVASAGVANVCLAGHSLGSAMALLAGKNMKNLDYFLETYIFNPPFISLKMQMFKFIRSKWELLVPVVGIYLFLMNESGLTEVLTSSAIRILKACRTTAIEGRKHRTSGRHDPFNESSRWNPHLFVNPADPICAEYIGYFKNRDNMESARLPANNFISSLFSNARDYFKNRDNMESARLPAKNFIMSLFSSARRSDSDALYLLRSAYLIVNNSSSRGCKQAHGIHQWWNPDFRCQSTLYQYPSFEWSGTNV